MKERIYDSVEELFKDRAPELIKFLESNDVFWSKVKNNTITDLELDGHQSLMEELGIFSADSPVAKAIQTIKTARKSSLPTPINIELKF